MISLFLFAAHLHEFLKKKSLSIKNPSVKFIIFVLMICTFSIGYTEYAVMGILTSIANDFHIQVSSARLLVTAYAASVCLTGPLVTIISVKLPRKPVLLGLMAIFILSNLMSALAPNFAVLAISRILSASIHGAFFAIAMVFASEMVPPEKRAAAAASMNGGLTVALMLGVPFGSYLGDVLNWRAVFSIITALGVIGFLGLMAAVPNRKPKVIPMLMNEWGVFKHKQVLFSLRDYHFRLFRCLYRLHLYRTHFKAFSRIQHGWHYRCSLCVWIGRRCREFLCWKGTAAFADSDDDRRNDRFNRCSGCISLHRHLPGCSHCGNVPIRGMRIRHAASSANKGHFLI